MITKTKLTDVRVYFSTSDTFDGGRCVRAAFVDPGKDGVWIVAYNPTGLSSVALTPHISRGGYRSIRTASGVNVTFEHDPEHPVTDGGQWRVFNLVVESPRCQPCSMPRLREEGLSESEIRYLEEHDIPAADPALIAALLSAKPANARVKTAHAVTPDDEPPI